MSLFSVRRMMTDLKAIQNRIDVHYKSMKSSVFINYTNVCDYLYQLDTIYK